MNDINNANEGSTGQLIDAHVHVLPPKRLAGLLRWAKSFMPDHPVPLDVDGDGIVADVKSGGVKYFFNLVYPLREEETGPLNEFNHALTRALPHSAGWGSLHPDTPDKERVTRRAILDFGFIGMKFHPFVQKFSILDPRMSPVYETLSSLRRPLFIHTGFDEFYDITMPPEHVHELASKYPDMPIVISHMLFPLLAEAFELMRECPGIIADLTNVPGAIKFMMKGSKESGVISETKLGKLLKQNLPDFRDRIIFGTDHPAGIGAYAEIYKDFADLDLSADLFDAITWRNPLKMVNDYLPGRWETL